VQDADWKDAKNGAKVIGHQVGLILTICDQLMETLAKQPDHMLAGQNTREPEELEAKFLQCASGLDSLPPIPAYESTAYICPVTIHHPTPLEKSCTGICIQTRIMTPCIVSFHSRRHRLKRSKSCEISLETWKKELCHSEHLPAIKCYRV
jgi:hypothetical protein